MPETFRLVVIDMFVTASFCGLLVVFRARLGNVMALGLSNTAGAVAVPERLTVWGLPGALSVMLTVPVSVPPVVGVKVTLMAQLAPAATEPSQVLVWAKSPLAVRLVIVSVASPVFFNVMVWGGLVVPASSALKVRLAGLSETCGMLAPVPLKDTVWGVEESDASIVSVPVTAPAAVGAKAICNRQV